MMGQKDKKRRFHLRRKKKRVRFEVMGAEILALQKAIQGYHAYLITQPGIEGCELVLNLLASLAQRLSGETLLGEERTEPFFLPDLEIGVAYDAVTLYLVAATLPSKDARTIAPLEDSTTLVLLRPFQRRLQAVVNQIAPQDLSHIPLDPSLLN